MGIFASSFMSYIRKARMNNPDARSAHIFYKLVDIIGDDEYIIQCINTKATFIASISDIVFDKEILNGLHPLQSCYIGIEYAKHLEWASANHLLVAESSKKHKEPLVSRYGRYLICYQNRKGDVCFVDQRTNREQLMDPCVMVFTEALIGEFDAAQAFHLGIFAGLKLKKQKKHDAPKKPYLKLVK